MPKCDRQVVSVNDTQKIDTSRLRRKHNHRNTSERDPDGNSSSNDHSEPVQPILAVLIPFELLEPFPLLTRTKTSVVFMKHKTSAAYALHSVGLVRPSGPGPHPPSQKRVENRSFPDPELPGFI